MGYKFL